MADSYKYDFLIAHYVFGTEGACTCSIMLILLNLRDFLMCILLCE